MCLPINAIATEVVRKKLEKTGSITVYKKYYLTKRKDGLVVTPPIRGGTAVIDKNGFILSNRKSAKITKTEEVHKEVNRGIHVYTECDAGLIPVLAHKKDFIAATGHDRGYGTNRAFKTTRAVFVKIQLTKESYKALEATAERKWKQEKALQLGEIKNFDYSINYNNRQIAIIEKRLKRLASRRQKALASLKQMKKPKLIFKRR